VLEGRATDLSIEAKEIIRLRKRLYEILNKHTGQPVEKIQRDSDRNLWLEAEEAISYGLGDKILHKVPDQAPKPRTSEDTPESDENSDQLNGA
jgi:ATP-dependent Clp protease protease subunit